MADAEIKNAPKGRVSSLTAPKRGTGLRVASSWKIPTALTSNKSDSRATRIASVWTIRLANGSAMRVQSRNGSATGNTAYKSDTLNLNTFAYRGSSRSRAYFYPLTSRKVKSVSVAVAGRNDKGDGPSAKATANFRNPAPPKVAKPQFAVEGDNVGHLTCVVTAGDDKGMAERYRTRYKFLLRRWFNTGTDAKKWVTVTSSDTSSTSTTIHFNGVYGYDLTGWQALADKHVYVLTAEAWSQGLAGDSAHVTRRIVVGPPMRATLGAITVSSTSSTGLLTANVGLTAHWFKTHKATKAEAKATKGLKAGDTVKDYQLDPVDGCRLQALVNVPYGRESQIPGDANWVDVGTADDGECSKLAAQVGDLACEDGNWTWLRVKTWRFDEEHGIVRYSNLRRVDALHVAAPTAADDRCSVCSLETGDDGESLVAVVGWNADDASGTELSWSDAEDSWRSTDGPDTHEFSWSDSTKPSAASAWAYGATITIKGLEQGVPYHVRARRYLDSDNGGRSWGRYCATKHATPTADPTGVTLAAPNVVPTGEGAVLSWTYGGGATQTAWQLLADGRVKASGTDAAGSHTVSAADLAEWATDGDVTLAVRVSTGGDFAQSGNATVRVADPPVIGLDVPAVLTAQPLQMGVTSDVPCTLAVTLVADGCSGDAPAGPTAQDGGDGVWSDVAEPEWVADGDDLVATVTAPEGLDLRDGATYSLRVVATDPDTGLATETEASFAVAWAHQAPAPAEPTITPYDVTDADGFRTRGCTLALTAPTGAAEGDLQDVYRVTPDGVQLVAEGVAAGTTIDDRYAPYGGGNAYRVAVVTADGDEDWDDFPYDLAGGDLRVDFGGDYVELPYNLRLSDGYEKDFEARRKLDGSTDGYWNQGVGRRGGLSTDVIRVEGAEQSRRVRSLARHVGPCFVRTPDGCAYEADVQVTGLSWSAGSSVLSVALDATEVGLTDEYRADVPSDEPEE